MSALAKVWMTVGPARYSSTEPFMKCKTSCWAERAVTPRKEAERLGSIRFQPRVTWSCYLMSGLELNAERRRTWLQPLIRMAALASFDDGGRLDADPETVGVGRRVGRPGWGGCPSSCYLPG